MWRHGALERGQARACAICLQPTKPDDQSWVYNNWVSLLGAAQGKDPLEQPVNLSRLGMPGLIPACCQLFTLYHRGGLSTSLLCQTVCLL